MSPADSSSSTLAVAAEAVLVVGVLLLLISRIRSVDAVDASAAVVGVGDGEVAAVERSPRGRDVVVVVFLAAFVAFVPVDRALSG